MKDKITSFILSFLLAYLICQLSGCSLTNSIRDETASNPSKPGYIVITGEQYLNIKSGTTVEVLLKSGQVVKGKYSGISPIPEEEYYKRYAARKEKLKDEVLLPEMGEAIVLLAKDGNQYEGNFFGFDFGVIRFKKTDSAMIGTWYMNVVDSIVDREGRRMESESLRLLMREGKVAFISAIILRIKKEESRIELDDVSQIQTKAPRKKSPNNQILVAVALIGSIALLYLAFRAMFGGMGKALAEMIN